jgi:hypothetical protein
VSLAAQLLEHLLGVGGVRRFAEDPTFEHDGGVDTDDGSVLGDVGNGSCFSTGVLAHELQRVGIGARLFVVLGRDDVEWDVQLLENRSSLR